jgi:hypothetical protein
MGKCLRERAPSHDFCVRHDINVTYKKRGGFTLHPD